MGGKGSGGARFISGPAPLSDEEKALRGSRTRNKSKSGQSGPTPFLDAPEGANEATKGVWNELMPLACRARTLTDVTAPGFLELCRAVVRLRQMDARLEEEGLTQIKITIDGAGQEHQEVKAHPLVSQHRSMMQRVEAGYTRFCLTALGKPVVVEAVAEEDPFAEFEVQ